MTEEIKRPLGCKEIKALSQPAGEFREAGTAPDLGLQADRKLEDQQAMFIPPGAFAV